MQVTNWEVYNCLYSNRSVFHQMSNLFSFFLCWGGTSFYLVKKSCYSIEDPESWKSNDKQTWVSARGSLTHIQAFWTKEQWNVMDVWIHPCRESKLLVFSVDNPTYMHEKNRKKVFYWDISSPETFIKRNRLIAMGA